MGLFGGSKPVGKTFVVLDVESGSVGGTLVRLSAAHAPRLVGETRVHLPVGLARDAAGLRQRTVRAIKSVAESLAHLAARLRGHPQSAPLGSPERAVVFLAAPWGVPDLQAGAPRMHEDLAREARAALGAHFDLPVSLHAQASAALAGARRLLPYEGTYLLCMPGGEITETLSVIGGAPAAYATLPFGSHSVMRTLQAHAGLSEPESRSALRFFPAHLDGAVRAAGESLAGEFVPAAQELGWGSHERVYVLSHEGQWLARMLARSDAAALFAQGSIVRDLRGSHASPHFLAHAHAPDLPLMLGALYVDAHYQ